MAYVLGTVCIIGLLLCMPSLYAKLTTSSYRKNINIDALSSIPERDVALVFGAGVLPDGELSTYLKNRVETAITLYEAGKVKKLVMSGDNRTAHYNEPLHMGEYAMGRGVPKSDIVLDYGGRSTYDSCWRTLHIFEVKSALLVTQGYHLPRSVMTCRGLGIDAFGVAAQRQGKDYTASYVLREWLSTDKALLQLLFKPSASVTGKPEPILIR